MWSTLYPCLVARLCDWISCLHLLSSSAACHHLPSAAAPPGPSVLSQPRRLLAWHHTAMMMLTQHCRLEIAMARSASSLWRQPHSTQLGPATCTCTVAMVSSRRCISSLTSPHWPATTSQTFPRLTSFSSTHPTCPSGVPCLRSSALAFARYWAGSWDAQCPQLSLSSWACSSYSCRISLLPHAKLQLPAWPELDLLVHSALEWGFIRTILFSPL